MDKWDKFADELNRMENLNHYSIISFWKARLEEETELYKRRVEFLNDEINRLKEMLERYAADSKQMCQKLNNAEQRLDYERSMLEEKLRAREAELQLEKNKTHELKKAISRDRCPERMDPSGG